MSAQRVARSHLPKNTEGARRWAEDIRKAVGYHPRHHFGSPSCWDKLGKSIGWRGRILFPSPAPCLQRSVSGRRSAISEPRFSAHGSRSRCPVNARAGRRFANIPRPDRSCPNASLRIACRTGIPLPQRCGLPGLVRLQGSVDAWLGNAKRSLAVDAHHPLPGA